MLGLLISYMTCVDCKQNQRIPRDRHCVHCGGKLSTREQDIWPERWERRRAEMLKNFNQWRLVVEPLHGDPIVLIDWNDRTMHGYIRPFSTLEKTDEVVVYRGGVEVLRRNPTEGELR